MLERMPTFNENISYNNITVYFFITITYKKKLPNT